MKNLIPQNIDDNDFFEDLVQRKHDPDKTLLQDNRERIRRAYSMYEDNKENLENISQSLISDDPTKSALIKCYNHKNLDKLKDDIRTAHRNAVGDVCQYCDLDRAKTIDHYLPKSCYPEYSILSINLIPCCYDCNTKKSKSFVIEGYRQFINYYYDRFNEVRFLKCSIDITSEQIDFSVDTTAFPTDSKLKIIIKNHFENLDLNVSYLTWASEEFSIMKTDVKESNLVFEDFKSLIEYEIKKNESKYGLNHYKTAFYLQIKDKIAELYAYFNE